MIRRDGFLQRRDASSSEPRFASSYTVTAYKIGAVVAATAAGTSVTVDAGHRFAQNDKYLVSSSGSISTSSFRTVSGVSGNVLTINSLHSPALAVGDILINLGPDGGAGTPNYDASPVSIYTDMDGGLTITNSRVTVDSEGNYIYWYAGQPLWELIRDSSGAPVGMATVSPVSGRLTPAAVTVTGSDAVSTIDRSYIQLTSNNSGTNTITLSAPSLIDGQILVLEIVALTAGTIALADSGNVLLSTAWTGDGVGDTLTLIASGVTWRELARSNNA